MQNYKWDSYFAALFEPCVARYRSGDADYENYYSKTDREFLDSIGYKPREFFDFVEDFSDDGEPSLTTAVMIANVRRDYLRWEMKGEKSSYEIQPDELPKRAEELDGIAWLPRILAKAKHKLRGELSPEIMFCCGGDRNFLRNHDIAPADFLHAVWSSYGDEKAIVEFLRSHASK